MQQSSDYEADLELNGLGGTQTRTQTEDGPDMTSSAQKDPFSFSNGPITRSQTRNLKKCIVCLVYPKLKPNEDEDQVYPQVRHPLRCIHGVLHPKNCIHGVASSHYSSSSKLAYGSISQMKIYAHCSTSTTRLNGSGHGFQLISRVPPCSL
ncbi:hypothetical protein F2Q70_00011059 [Brassica cretica]|uniref:Uncharacterized protein n=1 Tax=Brassica cretica TaxID=69181 RepID=A0A8S9LQR0_BRACR|nr:hypothetical protein F2Q70_00011059 [Brassica cretica]